MATTKKEEKILTYKGRALTRKDKVLYYGSMADKYIIMLQIVDSKEVVSFAIIAKIIMPRKNNTMYKYTKLLKTELK